MKTSFLVFVCFVVLLAACAKKDVTSEQSIQDLVSNTTNYDNVAVNKTVVKNETKGTAVVNVEPVELLNETPLINKKCRYSVILYDGCKWQDAAKTNFNLRILDAGKYTIPGVWFIITGDSGGVKTVKRTEDILGGGSRTYNIDYTALVKEIGVVKRFEVLPSEVINGTEYACENQHVYTIPETYCKPFEPIKVN